MFVRMRGLVLALPLLLLPLALESVAVPTIRSARDRKVEDQKEDNKRWLEEAQEREHSYYTQAETYYKQKLYRRAEKGYKRVLDVRYREWPIKEAGSGTRRYEIPANRTVRRRLDTSYSRNAKVRLATMDTLVAAKTEADQKAELDGLKDKAELAVMLDDPAKAYGCYGDVAESAASMPDSKMTVRYRLDMLKQQEAIVTQARQPLDEIEKLVKDKKTADAVAKLEEYKNKYGALMELVPELRDRYQSFLGTQEVRTENREQECMMRVMAGDTALLRQDYLTAKRHYETAMGMYPGTDAAKAAAKKLAQLLEDPKIGAAITSQQLERQCAPLLARARYFMRMQNPAGAADACKLVIRTHPKTKWATEAQEILDEIDEAAPENDAGEK